MEFKQSCPHGLTEDDLEELFGERLPEFHHWMRGQTVMVCEGREFVYNRAHNEDCGHAEGDEYTYMCSYIDGGHYQPTACENNPHGIVTYPWDVKRFILGLPIID